MTLTPLLPTMLAPVAEAARRALGLKPNVRVEVDNRRRGGPGVDVRIRLPNGVDLAVGIRPVEGAATRLWRAGPHLGLALLQGTRADDPDPLRRACLEAVGRLFLRAQRLEGAARAAELDAALAAAAPWRGLHDAVFRSAVDGVVGETANLRLGFGCNQDCGLCWQDRGWPDAPRDMLLRWVDELAGAGVRQLTLTGGEPTIHAALPAVLDRARHHGMRTMLQTNAVQLAKPAMLRRIGPLVDRFFVSLHAADAATSDAITRAPGTWARTVAGVRGLLGDGRRVGLNCVIDARNAPGLAAHGAFVVAEFVRPFPDNPLESVTYSRAQPYHDRALWAALRVPYDEVRDGVSGAVQALVQAGVVVDATSGSCGLPACLLDGLPELIHLPAPGTLAAVDRGFHADGRTGAACGRCVLRDRCAGPGPGYAQAFGDRGLRPFTEMPAIAARFPLSL